MSPPDLRPRYYMHPPVVERVATVFADMDEEHFEARFDDWRDKGERLCKN